MTFIEGLKLLRTTIKKKDKESLLLEYADVPYFKASLSFLTNPYDVVGISTKKMKKDVEPTLNVKTFDGLLTYLRQHPTGTDKDLSVVKGYLSLFENDDREIVSELIAKTLKVGLSAKTLNNVYGKDFVPTFDVQLAFPYDKKIQKYTDTDKFYVTQKLDGHRALTTVEFKDNQIVISTLTRRGQQIDGLTELHEDVITFIKSNTEVMKTFENGFVLDGELLLRNPNNLSTGELFQETSKVLRKDGEKKNVMYNLFDILPLNEFLYQKASTETYEYRRTKWLNKLNKSKCIRVIPVLDVINKNDIPKWSTYATEQGWEGVMLNAANGTYRKTRSPELLKVKKMHTADLEIVGFNEAISGAYKGNLGSLNVRLDDENEIQVGSGLTDEIRDEIWNNQDKYLGVMIEVQYFEMTTNKDGGKSLRFPVFKDFRFDKTPEDTNIE